MKAYAFALQDVKRAFQYYIDHYNNGRPFILVGHSQGTFHLMPLLEQMIDQTPLKDRLVAAYAIGIPACRRGSFGRSLKNMHRLRQAGSNRLRGELEYLYARRRCGLRPSRAVNSSMSIASRPRKARSCCASIR